MASAPTVGSLRDSPTRLFLLGPRIHWPSPEAGGREGPGEQRGGLLPRVGQEEGAESNAGHAAVPTALPGLKITMFTHFPSWDFCLPVRRG